MTEPVAPPPPRPASYSLTPGNPNPVPTERYVRLLVVLTALLLVGFVLYLTTRLLALIHHTVLLFALGGLLAYALDPLVEIVRGNRSLRVPRRPHNPAPAVAEGEPSAAPAIPAASRRRPRWLGVLTVFLVLFAFVGGGLYFLGREAIHQGTVFARDREHIQANARQKVAEADVYLQARGIPVNLTGLVENPPENVRKWGEGIAKSSLTAAEGASRGLIEGIVVLLIAAYFLLFSEEMRDGITQIAPARLRPYISSWQDDVNRILGGFVRGQAILALVLGGAAAVCCLLLGLKFWLLTGLFVVLASLLPVVGPYIGAIPAIASALLTPPGFIGPGVRVGVVIVLFFAINEFGSKVLYPRLVGRALGLHEVLVLFALLAGFEVGGITGVLFAAPLTALAFVTLAQVMRIWRGEPPVSVANEAAEGGAEAKAAGVP